MPWKEVTTMSQKAAFVACALKKEEPFKALCAKFQISRERVQTLETLSARGPERIRKPLTRPSSQPLENLSNVGRTYPDHKSATPYLGRKKNTLLAPRKRNT